MLNYNTTLPSQPPVSRAMQADMAKTLSQGSPYAAYGRNHGDVLRALADSETANLESQASRANTEYAMAQQQAQRNLALQGLQQMNAAQQNQSDLANSRLSAMVGFASPVLRSLFQ
jgi:hypothetical protein